MNGENLLQKAVANLRGRKVLVCPLNWGLGHATRCVPIVCELLRQQKEVVLAADGLALEFFRQEFPQLKIVRFAGIEVKYSSSNSQTAVLAKKIPSFVKNIATEHRQLRQIIAENHIETVISDNRFGLWNKHVETVYITHQLMVKMPAHFTFFEPILWAIHRKIIKKYNFCWIPDVQGDGNLAGDLAHRFRLPQNAQFVGWLSRFCAENLTKIEDFPYQAVALISGPEPQRTIFEEKVVKYLKNRGLRSLVVQGLPSENGKKFSTENIDFVPHLPTKELEKLIFSAPKIICRSGYSSLMDLKILEKNALLVPTPGQTEQEYLAERLKSHGFEVILQSEFGK